MIKLVRDYYLAVNGSSYICGKAASSRAERLLRGSERYYYTSLSHAVASTAEIALRNVIDAGEVQTLQEVVEELRRIRDEIKAIVNGKGVEEDG